MLRHLSRFEIFHGGNGEVFVFALQLLDLLLSKCVGAVLLLSRVNSSTAHSILMMQETALSITITTRCWTRCSSSSSSSKSSSKSSSGN